MRTKRLLICALLPLAASGHIVTACGGDTATNGSPDAAADATHGPEAAAPDQYVSAPDASKVSCTLGASEDPVILCTQKLVLQNMHEAALIAGVGIAMSWDATTGVPDVDGTGAPLHDVHDDAAYAAACGNYAESAVRYGDKEFTATAEKDLTTIAALLPAELATLPDEYTGELYFHLRDAAIGLRYIALDDAAKTLDALADSVGKKIFDHFVVVSASPSDAGADAAADAADLADGSAADGEAGSDAATEGGVPLPGDGVLASDPTLRDYAPGDVASGALALIDMAVHHAADDGAGASKWALAAVESFAHITTRGRDPSTGLYFGLLVPGAAAGRDDLSPRAPAPRDLLATETTGRVALALLRAADLVKNNASLAPLSLLVGYPFADRGSDALASLHGKPSLYDTNLGGYFQGVVSSSGTVLESKPTRANAVVLAALHRGTVLRVTNYTAQAKAMRTVIGTTTPLGVGLLAVLPGQSAFFRAVTKDFHSPAGADAGVSLPNSFVSSASLAAVEAMNAEGYGYPGFP